MRSLVLALASVVLPLTRLADIPLPGHTTRFDYESIDSVKRLLFVAHLGDGAVVVVNLKTNRVAGVVSGISDVHGVLAIPQKNVVYASATGTNEIVAIDERRLAVVARIPGGVYPDGMAYDPATARLFVSDEHGRTETIVDTRTNHRIATIDLGGEAGNTQYDPVTHRMLVNVQTLDELLTIDPKTFTIVEKTPLPGCVGNHGLSIDAPARRAYVACEDNAALVWVDLRTMRVVERATVGTDPDVLALDPARRRLYVAAESGAISIFATGPHLRRVAQGFFAPAAHSVAVDPQTHDLYIPLENEGGQPRLVVATESP